MRRITRPRASVGEATREEKQDYRDVADRGVVEGDQENSSDTEYKSQSKFPRSKFPFLISLSTGLNLTFVIITFLLFRRRERDLISFPFSEEKKSDSYKLLP